MSHYSLLRIVFILVLKAHLLAAAQDSLFLLQTKLEMTASHMDKVAVTRSDRREVDKTKSTSISAPNRTEGKALAPTNPGTIHVPFSSPAPPQESSEIKSKPSPGYAMLHNISAMLDNISESILDVDNEPSPSLTDQVPTPAPAPYTVNHNSVSPMLMPLEPLSPQEQKTLKATRADARYDCEFSDWSEWSDCIKVEGHLITGARQKRTKTVITPGNFSMGGIICHYAVDIRMCLTSGRQGQYGMP